MKALKDRSFLLSGGSPQNVQRSASPHFFPLIVDSRFLPWPGEEKAEYFYDHLTIVQLMLQHALFSAGIARGANVRDDTMSWIM